MKIYDKKGQLIDPGGVEFSADQFDLIYGTMTVGKTTLERALFNPAQGRPAIKFVDTDYVWECLYLTHEIWDIKRISPAVDHALSGPVRMITREIAERTNVPVLTNMYLPFGDALKVYREGALTYELMIKRAKSQGKDLKITRSQVINWSKSWCGFDPLFLYSVQLDEGEYLSDLFHCESGKIPSEMELLSWNCKLIREAFPDGERFLAPKPKPLDVALADLFLLGSK